MSSLIHRDHSLLREGADLKVQATGTWHKGGAGTQSIHIVDDDDDEAVRNSLAALVEPRGCLPKPTRLPSSF